MKNKIKGICIFILGMLVSGVSVYAVTTLYGANEVSYSNTSSGGSYTNVQDTIDELYAKVNVGDATESDILSGKTALVQGKMVTGSMANNTTSNGLTLTSADKRRVDIVKKSTGDARVWYVANSDGTTRLNIGIPYDGYYSTSNILAVNNSDLASALGITADKIASGQSIAGVAGTYSSKITSSNIHYETTNWWSGYVGTYTNAYSMKAPTVSGYTAISYEILTDRRNVAWTNSFTFDIKTQTLYATSSRTEGWSILIDSLRFVYLPTSMLDPSVYS